MRNTQDEGNILKDGQNAEDTLKDARSLPSGGREISGRKSGSRPRHNSHGMALTGLMTAVMCIVGPITLPIPVSPLPVSLTNFAVLMAVCLLGRRKGTISYLVYLLIGLTGVPVFSAFTGGPGKLLGPSGGYLIGFILLAEISGVFMEKWQSWMMHMCGMALGMLVCNLFGTVWLSVQSGISFRAALAAGVLPFIPGDSAKLLLALVIGGQTRRRLRKTGLLENI